MHLDAFCFISVTINPLQKEIYRSGQIFGVVRLLKGQEILPDDNTLAQHSISDGDTLSALIEPDKVIIVQLKYLGNLIHKTFSQSELVGNVKQAFLPHLHSYDPERIWFEHKTGAQLQETTILDDDYMPLHYCGLQDMAVLHVAKRGYSIVVVDEKNRELYLEIEKKTTFGEVKQKLMKFAPREVVNVSLFYHIQNVNEYKKVQDWDVKVLDLVGNRSKLFLISDRFALSENVWLSENPELKIYGLERGDCPLGVQLRGQDQLGVKWSQIQVYCNKYLVC